MSNFLTKCKNCGKQSGDHKAGSHHCPAGKKHRTHGYPWFNQSQVFKAVSDDELYTTPNATAYIDDLMDCGAPNAGKPDTSAPVT